MIFVEINLDEAPFCPEGLIVSSQPKRGKWIFDPIRILHFLLLEQKQRVVNGLELKETLADGKNILNANILDYLLLNPEFIPRSWVHLNVFFWGTIYQDKVGRLCVRYIYWGGSRWCSSYRFLELNFGLDSPAAIRS